MEKHPVKNKIPQQTVWDERGNLGSISGCVLTNPLPCLFSPCLLLGPGFGFWQGGNHGCAGKEPREMFPGRRKWHQTPVTFLAPRNADLSVKSLNLSKANTESW